LALGARARLPIHPPPPTLSKTTHLLRLRVVKQTIVIKLLLLLRVLWLVRVVLLLRHFCV
jgi:hypothetical protein